MNDNSRVTYAIWKDHRTGAFEVVRWCGNEHLVVQTNLASRGKAMIDFIRSGSRTTDHSGDRRRRG